MTEGLRLGGVFTFTCYKTKKVKRSLFERFFTFFDFKKAFPVISGIIKNKKSKWCPWIKFKKVILYKKWTDKAHNLVVNVGLQHVLDIVLESGGQVTTWYIGLTNTAPTVAAGDTMGAHGGWTENANYDEANRVTYVSARTAQTCSNSANKAVFTIDTDAQTIGGAFITSDNTKSGGGGTLLCAVAFTGGDKSADDDDVLNVQYDFGAADDGV